MDLRELADSVERLIKNYERAPPRLTHRDLAEELFSARHEILALLRAGANPEVTVTEAQPCGREVAIRPGDLPTAEEIALLLGNVDQDMWGPPRTEFLEGAHLSNSLVKARAVLALLESRKIGAGAPRRDAAAP